MTHNCPICGNKIHKINSVISVCTNDKCGIWGLNIPNCVLDKVSRSENYQKVPESGSENYQFNRFFAVPKSAIQGQSKGQVFRILTQMGLDPRDYIIGFLTERHGGGEND